MIKYKFLVKKRGESIQELNLQAVFSGSLRERETDQVEAYQGRRTSNYTIEFQHMTSLQ